MLERRSLAGAERASVAVEVPHKAPLRIAAHSVTQDMVVHPAADVYRVDLDVTVVRKRGADIFSRPVDQVGAPQETARFGPGNGPDPGHGVGRVGCERAAGAAAGPGAPLDGVTEAGRRLLSRAA